MKYLKSYNEMLKIESEIELFRDNIKKEYQKKIDNCMLYLTDEYDDISQSKGRLYLNTGEWQSFFRFKIESEEVNNFLDLLKLSGESMLHELDSDIYVVVYTTDFEQIASNMFSDYDVFKDKILKDKNVQEGEVLIVDIVIN